jgi:uncharacterized protein (DUF1015 family)
MADILPIRAWRYNKKLSATINTLTAPPLNVVKDEKKNALYQQPLNSIHLTAPRDGAASAIKLLQEWKRDEVLVQDDIPGIYVYYQYFKLPGSSTVLCRKGFVSHVRTYDWSDKVIIRHEHSIPGEVNDGIELLEKTELHSSPTYGLYADQNFQLERYMDEAITDPLYDVEDYQGVRNVLAVIHDATVIKKFMDLLSVKTVILADGHDKYENALTFKQRKRLLHPEETRGSGYNFHLMYLTNSEASEFETLPQESAYLHPKISSGLLFTSVTESEFVLPSFAPF